VSSMQTGLAVTGRAITGTLKYISTGTLADTWGPGHFMALKFTNNDQSHVTTIKVAMQPSVSSGFVALDADMNAVIKVTDKRQQVFAVQYTDGTTTRTDTYSVAGLTLADPPTDGA